MHLELVPVAEADVVSLVKSIDRVVINPLIFFLFALAMVYFLYGLVQFLISPDNEEVRKTSKSHMVWGLLGLFIMIAVFGIMNLILSTLHVTNIVIDENGQYNINGTNFVHSTDGLDIKQGSSLGIDTTATNVSNTVIQDKNLDPAKSPFPDYLKDDNLCWSYVLHTSGATEYEAMHPTYMGKVMDSLYSYARFYYLDVNGKRDISTDRSLPVVYDLQSLYSKSDNKYYVWLDLRAPTGTGKVSDCNFKVNPTQSSDNYKYLDKYKASDVNLSTAQNASITNFSKSPFPEYIGNASCWRDEFLILDKVEYSALNSMDTKSRAEYLSKTGQAETKENASYPARYGVQIAYNPKDQFYYLWVDLRAPVAGAAAGACNLPRKNVLPAPTSQSTKSSSLIGSVSSDASYYRVVDSGVSNTVSDARTIAIKNALIQLAVLKNLDSINGITYRVIQPEKYFPQDPATGLYDYFVAVESAR